MNRQLIRAKWLALMDREIIVDGAIAIEDGRVVEVGRFGQGSDVPTSDLGEVVLMPGLINAHTHLELSDCTLGEEPADGLEGWLTRMLTRTRVAQEELEAMSSAAAVTGAKACIGFGVTAVGDISRQCHVTRGVLKSGPLRVVSFGEVMAMAQRRSLLETRLEMAAELVDQAPSLRVGVSPHSPYSIEMPGFARCLEVAKAKGLPLSTHLAETRSEWEFLASHTGKLRELWDAWLTWDDAVPKFAGGPIRMARELGLLAYPAVLAHVNYCDDEELALLAGGRASVVYCPRTHRYFGHPPHRFREMIRAGINVAIGTDSCASSPDLNVVDDLRLVHERFPELSADLLWQLVTSNAAQALGLEDWRERGDLVCFPVSGNDPLREVLESRVRPSGVWIGGLRVK